MFLQNQIVPQKSKALQRWFSIKGNQSNSNLSGFGVLSKSAKTSGIESDIRDRK